jgi:hypothetical protein
MKWALSSVENFFGCLFFLVFSVLDQARLGLDVLPAHATRGKGGVASDWLCMWWEGRALGPAINIVAPLSVLACASLAWPSEWEPCPGCWISVSARR